MIGGGAVGVCCAYSLARAGRSVLLLERDALCAGSSWGNSGLLTTSACAPEAAPGVMGQAARWMLDRDGPFRLRPRLDPRLARWLWRFRQNCTADAARARDELPPRSRPGEHPARRGARPRDAARLRTGGRRGPRALHDREGTRRGDRRSRQHCERLGIPSEELDAAAVSRLEPRVSDAVVGGVLYPEDAHLDPGEYVAAVADLARSHGARIEEGSPVVRLHGSHGVEAIQTTERLIRPGSRRSRKRCLGAAARPQRAVSACSSSPARDSASRTPQGRDLARPLRLAEAGPWSRRCATTSASRASSTSSG